MQAQLLPIFLLTMPLALCFMCIRGCDAKERALIPVRPLIRDCAHHCATIDRGSPSRPAA